MTADPVQLLATLLFGIAVVHTFCDPLFQAPRRTAAQSRRALWHLLGEVEVVFGFWAFVLFAVVFAWKGQTPAVGLVEGQRFAEPIFVFVVVVVAGSRPILWAAGRAVRWMAAALPLRNQLSVYFCALSALPLLGSLITEPAAMTLARAACCSTLLLRSGDLQPPALRDARCVVRQCFHWRCAHRVCRTPHRHGRNRLSGGTADRCSRLFGWRSVLAVVINAAAVTFAFRRELACLPEPPPSTTVGPPLAVTLAHLAFLSAIVVFGSGTRRSSSACSCSSSALPVPTNAIRTRSFSSKG